MFLRKLKPYLWVLLLGILCSYILAVNTPERKALRVLARIPLEERRALDAFWRHFAFYDGFAFTLLGDKPVFLSRNLPNGTDYIRPVCYVELKKGWEVWQKYQHFFPSKRFILRTDYTAGDESSPSIIIFNKQSFLKTVQNHLDRFQEEIAASVTPEEILAMYSDPKSDLDETLFYNQATLGILLGYGKVNGELFLRRRELTNCIDPPIRWGPLSPSPGFNTLKEEMDWLTNTISGCSSREDESLNLVHGPWFVGDLQHPETQELLREYRKQRKAIACYYHQGNFLELTIKAWMRGECL